MLAVGDARAQRCELMVVELTALHHRPDELRDVRPEGQLRRRLLEAQAAQRITGQRFDKDIGRERSRAEQRASLRGKVRVGDGVRRVVEAAVGGFEARS
jgi:hypothetical protein